MAEPFLTIPGVFLCSPISQLSGTFKKAHSGDRSQVTEFVGAFQNSHFLVESIRSGNVSFNAITGKIRFSDTEHAAKLFDNKIYVNIEGRDSKLVIFIDIWNDFSLNVSLKRVEQAFSLEFRVPAIGHQQGDVQWKLLGVSLERVVIVTRTDKQHAFTVVGGTLYLSEFFDNELRWIIESEKLWLALDLDTRIPQTSQELFRSALFPSVSTDSLTHRLLWSSFQDMLLAENGPAADPIKDQIIPSSSTQWNVPLPMPPLLTSDKKKGVAPSQLLDPILQELKLMAAQKSADGSYPGDIEEKKAFLRQRLGCKVYHSPKPEELNQKLDEYINYYVYKTASLPIPHLLDPQKDLHV